MPSNLRRNLAASALCVSVMAVGIFLAVSAQMQAVNFYYSLIDDRLADTESNRRYHNEIENVEYNGGFEERVGALLMCRSDSFIQTITFVGRSCDKFISTSHAFYNNDGTYRCEDGSYGQVHKIARRNDGASHTFDSAARAKHKWHGGLDPSNMEDSYEWPTRGGTLAVKERGRVDNTRFGLNGGGAFMSTHDRHNDVQLLRLHEPAPSSEGRGNACSGTPNLEFVNISKMTDSMPLRQCFIHARILGEQHTGVYQGQGSSQLSIYRNTEPCHVHGTVESNTTGLMFKHNCPSHRATSGAPILCEIDGQYKVVDIHTGSPVSGRNKIQDPNVFSDYNYNGGVGFNDRFLEEVRN